MAISIPGDSDALASADDVRSDQPGVNLDEPSSPIIRILFGVTLVGALIFAGISVFADTRQVGETMQLSVFLFLGLALLIALGFEFVNGFHDTANAVATVIYTNAMSAPTAVVWAGIWNFIGVMLSGGAVAYSIIVLLPVDLILNVGSASGYAMIFALLLAAVGWNLATWYFGIPNSSSHALIGSILGVGVANQLISHSTGGTSGLDMAQVEKVLMALLVSPLVGFVGALVLILVLKRVDSNPKLYEAPDIGAPPPRGIRAVLIFACTAVSYAHGSNDGQKGMGLIMLILIGCAPTAYALNRTMPENQTPAFVAAASTASTAFRAHANGAIVLPADARKVLTAALQAKKAQGPETLAALAIVSDDVSARISSFGSLGKVPAAQTPNLRNDMYLVLDTAKLVVKDGKGPEAFTVGEVGSIEKYEGLLEDGTRYIPNWVKITVALALGLGTMVGWRRIVKTVGEKIGSAEFTYGMGTSAQLVAASTILLAAVKGFPVSTTHILTSGVAGAAVGNGQGLQFKTIGNMVLAWVLTLPAAMALSGGLYWLLLQFV